MIKISTDRDWLRKPCKKVEESDPVAEVAEKLFQVLREDPNAFGISANQIGYGLHIFAMRLNPLPPVCIINGRIMSQWGRDIKTEQCLSLPGVEVEVARPRMIRVDGVNQYWKAVSYRFSEMRARIACHELDHAEGILMIDKAGLPFGGEK